MAAASKRRGDITKVAQQVIGARRKERDEEKEGDAIKEGEKCGIQKKIGLDGNLMTQYEAGYFHDSVAGPTSWALGDQ